MIPFSIKFVDIEKSDAVESAVESRIEKLERFFDRIVRCDVTLSCPHRHRHADRPYQVQIHIAIPGDDIFVNRHPSQDESHHDIYIAIQDAFNAAGRILQDRVRILRHQTKVHENEPRPKP